jgi:hypothetical protein
MTCCGVQQWWQLFWAQQDFELLAQILQPTIKLCKDCAKEFLQKNGLRFTRNPLSNIAKVGLPAWNRTKDLQLRRLLLYPTELRTEMKKGLEKRGLFYFYGRGDRIRTYDPLVPNQMRYQAALRPDTAIVTRKLSVF